MQARFLNLLRFFFSNPKLPLYFFCMSPVFTLYISPVYPHILLSCFSPCTSPVFPMNFLCMYPVFTLFLPSNVLAFPLYLPCFFPCTSPEFPLYFQSISLITSLHFHCISPVFSISVPFISLYMHGFPLFSLYSPVIPIYSLYFPSHPSSFPPVSIFLFFFCSSSHSDLSSFGGF